MAVDVEVSRSAVFATLTDRPIFPGRSNHQLRKRPPLQSKTLLSFNLFGDFIELGSCENHMI